MGFSVSDTILLEGGWTSDVSYPYSTNTEDGSWVVTWMDADNAVHTQRYTADGAKLGDPILVHPKATQIWSSPVALADGGWVQCVENRKFVGLEERTYWNYLRYDADGELVGKQSYRQPGTVVALEDGGYLIWTSRIVDWSTNAVEATVFDAAGVKIARLDLGDASWFQSSHIKTLADGSWIAFLNKEGEFGTYKVFDASGNLKNTVVLGENEQVSFGDDGSYKLVHSETDYDLHAVVRTVAYHAADGSLIRTIEEPAMEFDYAYSSSVSSTLANGTEIFVWNDIRSDGTSQAMMRLIGADGGILLDDTEMPYGGMWTLPRIIPLADGRWLVEWSDGGINSGYWQLYNVDGSTNGPLLKALGKAQANADGGWLSAATGYEGVAIRHFEVSDGNHAPVALWSYAQTYEETPLTFQESFFTAYETDGDAIIQIIIEGLPNSGTLLFKGVAVEEGLVIQMDDIGDLTWTPSKDTNSEGTTERDRLMFNVVDEHGLKSTQAASLDFTIFNVNDAPVPLDTRALVEAGNRTHLIDTSYRFSDLEGNNAQDIIIDSLPERGILKAFGKPVEIGDVVSLGALVFDAPKTVRSGDTVEFSYFMRDDGGTLNGGTDTSTVAATYSLEFARQPFIRGTSMDDNLVGSKRDEVFYDYSGHARLFGGGGDDNMFGGWGADVFKFANLPGDAQIWDFQTWDRIDLKKTQIADLDDLKNHYTETAEGHVVIDLGQIGKRHATLTIQHVDFDDFTDRNFIF